MPALPNWLKAGAKVAICDEGPWWKVVKIDGAEVVLNAEGDDHPVTWGIDRFLAVWQPFRATRFGREDPI